MKTLVALLALLLFPLADAQGRGCGRTFQTYHSHVGWNQGCSTTGCHASSSTQTKITANYEGDDYRHGVMLGIVKGRQKSNAFIAEMQALGLTSADFAGTQYGNQYLPQYAQQGKLIIGSNTATHQYGVQGTAEQFPSQGDDAQLSLYLTGRVVDAAAGMWNNAAPGALAIADRHIAANARIKEIEAVGITVARSLIAARQQPSTTTVTQNYRSITQPNGQVIVEPIPQQPPQYVGQPPQPGPGMNGPPQAEQPGGQYGSAGSRALGAVPDVVVTKCNTCHLTQKKVLIGPSLSGDARVEAVRRVLLPPDDPDHMPKKPDPELTNEEGSAILKYLYGK